MENVVTIKIAFQRIDKSSSGRNYFWFCNARAQRRVLWLMAHAGYLSRSGLGAEPPPEPADEDEPLPPERPEPATAAPAPSEVPSNPPETVPTSEASPSASPEPAPSPV